MSQKRCLTTLIVLLATTMEIKTQFYDFFNHFPAAPATTKTITRHHHYEYYVTPDDDDENNNSNNSNNNNRKTDFNKHNHEYDSSEESNFNKPPFSYFIHEKDSRTEKPRATVKIKTTTRPARRNPNNSDNSSQNNRNNKPDYSNHYYNEENDHDGPAEFWGHDHSMNKRKPTQSDNNNIFNARKTTTAKPVAVSNSRYPSNDNNNNSGRPTNNYDSHYNNDNSRPSYTTLKPIFNNDRQTSRRSTTTTQRPSYVRPEYTQRPYETESTTRSTNNNRPEYGGYPDDSNSRPNNSRPQKPTTTTRPDYNGGFPNYNSGYPSNGNNNNPRPQQQTTTTRADYNSGFPDYNSGYPGNSNNNGFPGNNGWPDRTPRPDYSGYPTNSNNNGFPSNNNNNGYSNNNNNGYPSNNGNYNHGRPSVGTHRPGVKPTKPPQGPPITNKPVTQRPSYSFGYGEDEDAIRFPDEEDSLTPELTIGPDEDRMSETQRRRYVDFVERLCTTYKAGDTSVVAAIPLLPSPTPVKVNVSECGPSSVPLVVGGRVLDIQQMPHNAALGWRNAQRGGYSWKCGGSLINEQFVLTAGHCATQERDNSVDIGPPRVVQLGSSYINDPGALTIKVAKSIMHPKYKPPRSYYDLALLKLASRVTFSEMIKPACIGVAPPADHAVIATGWGRTQFGGDTSDVLRGVSLPIWALDDCSRVLGRSRRLPEGPRGDSQVCAGERAGGKDTCQGDSGGPIQVQDGCVWRVVGVTSLGRACGAAGTPALYAIAQRAFIGAVLNSY